jgi:hypothetical protein
MKPEAPVTRKCWSVTVGVSPIASS